MSVAYVVFVAMMVWAFVMSPEPGEFAEGA